ncbi:SpaA isopeptide-forming pilin-related protein, partial [Schaalia sp. lx-100]
LTAIEALTLLDVLPQAGDHKVVPNQRDEYLPRTWLRSGGDGSSGVVEHSAFETPLTGPVDEVEVDGVRVNDQPIDTFLTETGVKLSANAAFEYFYSLDAQGVDTASVVNSRWLRKDEVSDWSRVKSVKAVLRPGMKILSAGLAHIVTGNRLPFSEATKGLDIHSRAINSLATSEDGINFREANEVTAENIKYSIDGIAFFDIDRDGNARADEARIGGRRVVVVRQSDSDPSVFTVARDPAGVPIVGRTDEDGHYRFEVYARGNYAVRFLKEDTETVAPAGNGVVSVANHSVAEGSVASPWDDVAGDVAYVQSTSVSLQPTHRHDTRNAAFVSDKQPLSVRKVDQDGEPIQGITFTLRYVGALDGQPELEVGDRPGVQTGVTDSDGLVRFKPSVFGKYTLSESGVPEGIEGLSAPKDLVLDGQALDHDDQGVALAFLRVVNTRVKADVTVKKTDA